MRSPHLALCAIVLAVTGLMTHAQSDKSEASSYAFSTHSYPFSAWDLEFGFTTKDKRELKAPALPPPSAGQGEQEAFLKHSHEVVKEYLATQEVLLPPGSLACYDADSETLGLRTTNAVHDMVEVLSDSYLHHATKHLSWRLEIIEAPSADVRAMVAQCQGQVEHGKLLDALTAKGTVITTMRGETKGGQQVSTRQGSRFSRPTEYATGSSGHVETAAEDAFSGLLFELDPVIGENGLIDINCSFQYWPTAPKARLAQLTAGSSPKVEAEWLDVPAFTTKFGSSFWSGQTRLIGVWDLEALADPAKVGRSQAAFLCAHNVSLLPLPEPRLEAMLRDHGEAVIPTPKADRPAADPTLPPGLIERRFRVPPDFLTILGGSSSGTSTDSPVDPFAVRADPSKAQDLVRHMTEEEFLKEQGIPFPPGSSARFQRKTCELIVRNLPENLELVEAFFDGWIYEPTKSCQVTVEIIEADASFLRRLIREVEALPDHTATQKALEAEIAAGKARVVRTVWIMTKSGQQAKWQNVIQTQAARAIEVPSAVSPKPVNKEGKSAAAEAKAEPPHNFLKVTAEDEAVGCQIEVDPITGENGAIDLNIQIKADTAPAGTLTAAAAPEPGILRLASVNPVRRGMEFKTSVTLRTGIPRLLSVYQPTKAEGQAADVLHAVLVRCTALVPQIR